MCRVYVCLFWVCVGRTSTKPPSDSEVERFAKEIHDTWQVGDAAYVRSCLVDVCAFSRVSLLAVSVLARLQCVRVLVLV